MRLTYLNEAGLNEKQQAVLDAIATGPRGAGMGMAGPFGVFVRAPHLGDPAQRLGGAPNTPHFSRTHFTALAPFNIARTSSLL